MHILLLTNRIPYPLKDGGSLAMHYFLEGYLDAGLTVSMLAMNTSKHFVALSKLPKVYERLQVFRTVDIDNEVHPLQAFINLFQFKKSYNVERFVSKAYDNALIDILQNNTFDFIQLEGLYLTPYINTIRKYSKAKVILRSHNIEFKIWEKLHLQESGFLKKAYLKLITKRLKSYELEHLNSYDIILPISNVDRAFYEEQGVQLPLYTQTFGIKIREDLTSYPVPKSGSKMYHIGAMDWRPNMESVKWLIQEIMPEIYKSHPDNKLYLAGRNMPEAWQQASYPNIDVVGEVESAYDFEQDKQILLVPLMSGGGVRIKIFQAMAMGKAVITTPIGVEGIEVAHKEHLLVADDKQEFVEYVRYLLDNPSEIERLGKNAKETISNYYSRDTQIQELIKFLETHRN